MNYTLNTNKGKTTVVETKTDRVIFSSDSRKEAISVIAKLHKNCGFAGYTPNFFLDLSYKKLFEQ